MKADLVYACPGFHPNTSFADGFLEGRCNKSGHIIVNEYLQLKNHENIFAAGDIIDIVEESLAANAVQHANVVAYNIKAIMKEGALKRYKSKHRTMLISLGEKTVCVRNTRVWQESRKKKISKLRDYFPNELQSLHPA